MRKLLLLALSVAALAAGGTAGAGGWATVGVEPPPPDEANEPWNVTVTVLRHGRTPTDGARPMLTIRNRETGATKTYALEPAGSGRYTARIVFPSAGTWSYVVNNGLAATGYGMSATQTFAPVEIGPRDGGASPPVWSLRALLVLALVATGAALVLLARRRRPRAGLAPTA